MTFSEKLKKLRKEKKITQEQLAQIIGVERSSIGKYETGTQPSTDNMKRIADYFGVTVDYLLGREEIKKAADNIDSLLVKHPQLFRPKMRKVPILGGVACGEPIYSPNLDEEFALVNEDINADFALVAKGDSMINAGIGDGDVIYIQAQDMVDNGQIAAVIISEEVTLKRVYYYRDKNKLVLQPENPSYEPLVYMNEELNEIRILGRAVAQLRKIR